MNQSSSSKTPVKAYKNHDFLNSHVARSIRVQCELLEPEQRFKRNEVNHTVVMFGSARIPNSAEAAKRLISAEKAVAESDTDENREHLRVAKALNKASIYSDHCTELSAKLTQWSLTIADPSKRMHVMSGGGPGVMEAANRGAFEAGGKSIGLGISLPFEQGINAYCSEDLGMEFHYFFVRKYWFLYMAKAIVVFPGGFGTMDELFEMLTLIQTRKTHKHVPIVLFGSEFWTKLINFETFIEWGVISPADINLFRIMDNVDEVFVYLKKEFCEHYGICPL